MKFVTYNLLTTFWAIAGNYTNDVASWKALFPDGFPYRFRMYDFEEGSFLTSISTWYYRYFDKLFRDTKIKVSSDYFINRDDTALLITLKVLDYGTNLGLAGKNLEIYYYKEYPKYDSTIAYDDVPDDYIPRSMKEITND